MMNPFLRKMVFVVLFAALLSALIVWWAFRDQSLALVQKRGLIRIGYFVETPYAFLKPNIEVTGESGNAAGLSLSAPSLRWMMMQNPKGLTEIAQPFHQPKATFAGKSGYGGFGFRLGDRRLHEAWNRAQEGFIGSQEHLELIRNFGFGEIDLPGSVTTEEVLSS